MDARGEELADLRRQLEEWRNIATVAGVIATAASKVLEEEATTVVAAAKVREDELRTLLHEHRRTYHLEY